MRESSSRSINPLGRRARSRRRRWSRQSVFGRCRYGRRPTGRPNAVATPTQAPEDASAHASDAPPVTSAYASFHPPADRSQWRCRPAVGSGPLARCAAVVAVAQSTTDIWTQTARWRGSIGGARHEQVTAGVVGHASGSQLVYTGRFLNRVLVTSRCTVAVGASGTALDQALTPGRGAT